MRGFFCLWDSKICSISMNEFMNGTEFLHAGRDAIVFGLIVN